MNPLEWSWFARSLLSLIFVIPAWLLIGFFEKTYQIRGEITALWYFFGTAVGMFFFLRISSSIPIDVLIPPLLTLSAIIATGIILGSLTNVFIFSAMSDAPNPAIPLAIQGTSAAFLFILAILLGLHAPKFFPPAEADPYKFIGILVVLLGSMLIIFGRNILTVLSLR